VLVPAGRSERFARRVLRVFVCVAITAAVGACDRNSGRATGAATRAAAKEPWVEAAPAQWPQIVLTNHATFRGHSALRGASSFLVRTADGRVLGATAKHLIGDAGGVEPPVRLTDLDRDLESWAVFPRTAGESAIELGRLAIDAGNERAHDWLLMSVKTAQELPARPLRMRETPVREGETVYLIGVPYSEPESAQNVYAGVVAERKRDRFRYTLNPPVDLRGFSGAPIVDADGRVVGVMTIWFKRQIVDEKDTEGGGEDSTTALGLLGNDRAN
jgi:hypothetical protein